MPKVKSTPKGRTRRIYSAHPYKSAPKNLSKANLKENARQHYIAMLPDYENVANTPISKKLRESKKPRKTRRNNSRR